MVETKDKCEIINKIKLTITTSNKRGSGTDDPIKLYIGEHFWELKHPFCNDFEKGKTDVFNLDVPENMTSDWFQYFCMKKDVAVKGKWILSRVKFEVNGRLIYDSGKIDYVFARGKTTWCAKDFFYGKCRGNVSPDFV